MNPEHWQKSRPPSPFTVLVPGLTIVLIGLVCSIVKFSNGDKKFLWAIIATSAMSILWVALMFHWRDWRKNIEVAQRERESDATPWLRRDDWARGEIARSKDMNDAYPAFFFFGAIPVGLAIVFGKIFMNQFRPEVRALTEPDPVKIVPVLIFGVVGLVSVISGCQGAWRKNKSGRAVFKMSAVPGIVGGKLEGNIQVSVPLEPEDGFKLRLSCLNSSGRGATTLWSEERQVQFGAGSDDSLQTVIPVSFDIPAGCEETNDSNPGNAVIWILAACAKLPGLNYRAIFAVPIFKMAQERQETESDPLN